MTDKLFIHNLFLRRIGPPGNTNMEETDGRNLQKIVIYERIQKPGKMRQITTGRRGVEEIVTISF